MAPRRTPLKGIEMIPRDMTQREREDAWYKRVFFLLEEPFLPTWPNRHMRPRR